MVLELNQDFLSVFGSGWTTVTSVFIDTITGNVIERRYVSLNNLAFLLFTRDISFVPANGGWEVCVTTGNFASLFSSRFSFVEQVERN